MCALEGSGGESMGGRGRDVAAGGVLYREGANPAGNLAGAFTWQTARVHGAKFIYQTRADAAASEREAGPAEFARARFERVANERICGAAELGRGAAHGDLRRDPQSGAGRRAR